MKIHFCDLCNESVPQAALDSGEARMVKGRVICRACDAAMSHGAEHEPLGSGPLGATAALANAPSAPAHASASSPVVHEPVSYRHEPHLVASHHPAAHGFVPHPAAPPPVYAPAPAPREPAASHTGIAWVAGIAIGFTALSIFVTDDRLARLDRAQGGLETGLAQRDEAFKGLAGELNKVHPALAGVEARLGARIDARAQADLATASTITTIQDDVRRLTSRFEGLAREVETLRARAAEPGLDVELEKRFDELTGRIAKAEDERRALADRLTDAELAAAAPAPTAAAPAPAAEPAAWAKHVPDLGHAEEGVRWDAVSALGEANDPAVVPLVLPMLKDPSYIVRMAAARVLGEKLRARSAVPALIEALEDSDSAVRESAWIALRAITGKDLKFESNAPEAERSKRVKAWSEWWKKEGDPEPPKVPSGT